MKSLSVRCFDRASVVFERQGVYLLGINGSSDEDDPRPVTTLAGVLSWLTCHLQNVVQMKASLNKRVVAQALPQAKPYEVRDTVARGLILRVQPSGHKAWVVTWAHGRRRTLGSVEHLSLDQAREQARQAVAEYVQSGLPVLAKEKVVTCTLADFIAEHLEPWAKTELKAWAHYIGSIRAQFGWLMATRLHEIDPLAVDRWWRERVSGDRPVTKATAGRNFACLRSALSRAVDWGLIDRNPLGELRHRTPQSRAIVRFLSRPEEARLRARMVARDASGIAARTNANRRRMKFGYPVLSDMPAGTYFDHLTPMVLLAMNTGLRRGELLKLRWSDVNLEARMLTVRAENAKSGKQRHVPLNGEAVTALSIWQRSAGVGRGRVFDVGEIRTAWERLLVDSEIADFRFHDLRHHFASRLVSVGVDLNTVRELLGHADIKMTLRYAHLAPDGLAAAVSKLVG